MTESLLKFSKTLDGMFFSHLRSLADVLWTGGWYGIALLPVIIMLGINGIRFAAGEFDGDKYRGLLRKFFYSLLFLGFGLYGMPLVEQLATYLNTAVISQVGQVPEKMYSINRDKVAAAGQRISGALAAAAASGDAKDPELTAFIAGLTAHEKILFDQGTLNAAKDMSHVLLPEEVSQLQSIISKSGAIDAEADKALQAGMADLKNASQAAAKWDTYRQMDPEELMLGAASDKVSLWSSSLADIVAMLFLLIGTVFKVIILFIRGCLLFIFRISLPISIALSFMPTFEGAVKEWWENYKTLALMLVTMTCIEALMTASWLATRVATDIPSAGITNALVALIGGILYLLTPTITVMMFGGSQAMAGLSQQVMSAGAIMMAATKMAGSAIYSKNEKTGEVKGAVAVGRNIIAGVKDAIKEKGSSGGGGGGAPTPPIV
ncbi:MAG: hypothetical protein LBJ57_07655 [Prevotellaceae bacterium]|jgi:hypothetical protein|nr:hypothetical protein [Prevotellaceae bacterium]